MKENSDRRLPSPDSPRQGAATSFLKGVAARGTRAVGRLASIWGCATLFSVEETGEFAFYLALGAVILLITDLGVSEQMLRSPAASSEGRPTTRRTATKVRGISVLVLLVIASLLTALLHDHINAAALGALAFGASLGLADFLGAARRSHGEAGTEIADSAIVSFGSLFAAAAMLLVRFSFESFAITLGIASTLLVSIRFAALLHADSHGTRPTTNSILTLIRDSRWLWPRSLLGWLFLDLAVLLLGMFSKASQVAVFAAAARLVGLVSQPMMALGFVFTPALAHERELGAGSFRELALRLNQISLLMIPGLIASALLLGRVALAGLGDDYQRALPVLWLLVLAYAIYCCVLSNIPLIVLGRERLVVWSMLFGQIMLALLVYVLAPSKGAIGAALAVIVGLSVPKAFLVVGYRQCEQSLGGAPALGLLTLMVLWTSSLTMTTGVLHLTLLIVGGLASAVASWFMLSRTTIRVRR